MKQIIFIPRLFLPRGDFEKWSVIAGDRFTCDGEYLKQLKEEVGEYPSTLRFVYSEAFSADDEEFVGAVREEMYAALEEGWIDKLSRGSVLVERETSAGSRYGIVACIDLEAYTEKKGETSPIRPAQEADGAIVNKLLKLRRETPLEFSHAAVLYKDPKNKIMRGLLKEDLEELYDFALSGNGGKLRGWFLPEYLAEEVAEDLPTKGDPCFVAIDGCSSLAAAKRHWESVKEGLTSKERLRHPARFALVEFMNICDDAVRIFPVNRVLAETDTEALCDYFSRNIKCRREGNVLYVTKPPTTELFAEVNGVLDTYLRANGGRQYFVSGGRQTLDAAKKCEGVAVVFGAFEKDDLFSALKDGKLYPKKSLCLGEEDEARYYTEGREIGYD
ncbi:MAG: DUF1015 domain-containing protein [Clostridiales bacterium]|nr:DUF1015 domain-containing protein [Clostridiales bacterium]